MTQFRDPENLPVFWETPATTGAHILTHPGEAIPASSSLPLLPFLAVSGACAALAGGVSEPGCALDQLSEFGVVLALVGASLQWAPILPEPHWATCPAALMNEGICACARKQPHSKSKIRL